jgi:hypothetical protein
MEQKINKYYLGDGVATEFTEDDNGVENLDFFLIRLALHLTISLKSES